MSRWRWVAAVVGLVIAVLVAVVLVRACQVESPAVPAEQVDVQLDDPDEAVQRLSEAIQIPTVSPEDEDDIEPFVELREQLEEWFPRFHHEAQRQLVSDLTPHYTLEGADPDAKDVVFLAHKDVVPVEEGTEDDWTYPPFSGAVEEGYIWGRGTLDNKHNMMALLEAAEAMLEEGKRPQHTLHFVFGHDEEIGGMEGARVVADNMKQQGLDVQAVYDEGLVVTDGIVPGVDEPLALVGIVEKGYLTVRLTARGEGGHASMPPKDLAISNLLAAVSALETSPMPAAVDGPVEMMFDRAVAEMGFGHRVVFRNLWLFEPLVLSQMVDQPSSNAAVRTTAAPTVLRAGQTENVLPQTAEALVNFRIHPRDSIDDVMAYLEGLVGDEVQVEKLERMQSEPSPVASVHSRGYEAIETAFAEVFGDVALAPSIVVAATDARHFSGLTDDVYRFTPVVLDADDLERIHGTDERVGVEAYLDLVRYYHRLLRHW